MKILFCGAGYPPGARGGTEVHMEQLARVLTARGHEVAVFAKEHGEAPEFSVRHDEHEGIAVARITHNYSTDSELASVFRNDQIARAFAEELDRCAPDLVHIHHFTGLSTTLIDVAKARGLAVVVTLHDFWTVCPRGQRITPELELCTTLDRSRCEPCLQALWPHFGLDRAQIETEEAKVVQRLLAADRLITPSAFHRERMLEVGLDPERIVPVLHGLDHERIPARERELRWPMQRIGFIGSGLPSKGVHVLIDAVSRLQDPEMTLHIHGEFLPFHGDTAYQDSLQAAASEGAVTLHGAYDQAELPGILADLDLIVVPSVWWETFCLTVREAMLAGVPVLASGHGAMAEALQEIAPHLLFKPGDAEDLAERMRALQDDEDLYRAAGSLRGEVRTLEAMASDTERIYEEARAHAQQAGSVDLGGQPPQLAPASEELLEAKRNAKPYATVFIPTWNGGRLFHTVLSRILEQDTDFEYEVLVIDSGSKDGTLEHVQSHAQVRLIQIPNSEFNHGLTRNRAVEEARGQIVALVTQDAVPYDEHWLQSLVDNFDDPNVAGAYCHQLPREDCNPFQMDRLKGWTRGEGQAEIKQLKDPAAWEDMHPFERYKLAAFDDVASCVRKSVMAEIPYAKRQFGEDVDWGKRAILAGKTVVMDPHSVVVHSHNNSIWYEFKRVYLDHQNLNDLFGLTSIHSFGFCLKCSVHATKSLGKVVWRDPRGLGYRLKWMAKVPLYAFSQNLAQFLGARSNRVERKGFSGWLDKKLRKGV